MDSLLVFPLILAFLYIGQSQTSNKVTNSTCSAQCPAGQYKVGSCSDNLSKCERCENGSYTELPNTIPKCLRCKECNHYETKTKLCSSVSDTICECIEGLWRDGERCQRCPCRSDKEAVKESICNKEQERCLGNPACKEKCKLAVLPPQSTEANTMTTTSVTPSATPPMNQTATGSAPSTIKGPTITKTDSQDHTPWLFLVAVVVPFLMLFCLILLCPRSPIRYPDCRPCCHANKEVEPPIGDPIFNKQRSHRGSSPTTLILNISEETPMMDLSPAPPEHPVHTGPVLPDAKHRGARQEEQSEQWPAIVLYAIIKEVPLRRWKEFLRLLSVADQQLERVELEASLGQGFMERQYQMLRLWSQRSTSSLNDVFSALHYMDLSGCAQLLQESLEKLQWRPEMK